MTVSEQFAEACKTTNLERVGKPDRHIAYSVRIVSLGQAHEVDGPFFTEAEAAIVAGYLKSSCRSAKVESCGYQDHPTITPKLILDCQASRARLAQQLVDNQKAKAK